MSGAEEAHRVVFEFDTVEQIKSFDPGSQASSGNLPEVVVYPAREVIWDETRVAALESRLAELPEFTPDGRVALAEHLRLHGTVEGEELFYPVAFERPASLVDS